MDGTDPRKPVELPRGVRAARRGDVQALSRMLARAFERDPMHRWLFPSDRAFARNSHRTFALLLADNLDEGALLTTEALEGAALWNPPWAQRPGLLAQLRLAAQLLPRFGLRFARVVRGFQRIEAAQPRQRHWYLGVLGTDPPHQGRGVGASLLDPVLRRADADALPAYLEASRVENVPYYRRFGFEVTEEIEMPDGPTLYGMRRDPGAGLVGRSGGG